MADIENPLTPENLIEIDEALERAKLGEIAIKKAQSAGIEIPDLLDNLRKQAESLRKIKRIYFPGQ